MKGLVQCRAVKVPTDFLPQQGSNLLAKQAPQLKMQNFHEILSVIFFFNIFFFS